MARPAPPPTGCLEIDVAELRAALAARPRRSFSMCARDGRALGAIMPSVHVPLGALERRLADGALARLDPSVPTVVYCPHGIRSLQGSPDPGRAARISIGGQLARRLQSLGGKGLAMRVPVCVLTVAGSDSGAGAGMQADARAIGRSGGMR